MEGGGESSGPSIPPKDLTKRLKGNFEKIGPEKVQKKSLPPWGGKKTVPERPRKDQSPSGKKERYQRGREKKKRIKRREKRV